MTTLPKSRQIVRRTATIRDVAKLAGVSIKTVSRVVNREAGVSSDLLGQVESAIRMLNYQHNAAAGNLRRLNQRTATIGLILDDVANPYCSAMHRSVEKIAHQHGMLVLTGSNDEDAAREAELAIALASRRVDGLIVMPATPEANYLRATGHESAVAAASAERERNALLRVRQSGCPIVFVDRPAPFADADSVTVDNRSGSTQGVLHLARHGHRRIAFLGDWLAIWTAAERRAGYIEGLALAGLPLDPRLVQPDLRDSDAAQQITGALLDMDNPPTALFTSRNQVTIGAVRALQERDMQQKIALLGFDDFALADMLKPGVSVLAQDPVEIGRVAAELIFARLAGDQKPPEHRVLPIRLIARGSGEISASQTAAVTQPGAADRSRP